MVSVSALARRSGALPDGWETVVGLEVHAELSTATKLFCGCVNRFGDEPNTNVCPVCMGLPGALPVVNEAAVDFAMRVGRALGCEVRSSVFARKHYFYPDMPHGYQISQYDQPTNVSGSVELPDGHVVGVERAHIEADSGKTTHIGAGGRIQDASCALVDYNRAGVPLVEIVSRPDIGSADQARAYVRELRAILLSLGVSDARMEEGSMRVDANVSVRPAGADDLRTRCEIKNLSSLRSLGRAIAFEARRMWICGRAVSNLARRPATGTKRAGAPRRVVPKKTSRTTATSRIPTWCRCGRQLKRSLRSTPDCLRCQRLVGPRYSPTTRERCRRRRPLCWWSAARTASWPTPSRRVPIRV